MQLKSKLKAVAAVLALAAAGQAAASIDPGSAANGGNAEIWFAVYDPVAAVAYVKDTGVHINDFIANGNAAGYTLSYNLVSTPEWANFTTATSSANWKWMVGAGGYTGAVASSRALTTYNGPRSDLVNVQTNSNLYNMTGNASNFVNANTGLGSEGTSYAINGSNTAGSGDGLAYFGNSLMTGTWGTKFAKDATAGVGQSMNFFEFVASSSSGLSKANVTQFGDNSTGTLQAGTWTLSANGNLTYNVPGAAPAPVPVPAAVWLLGSGLVGLVSIARRRAV